MFEIRTDQVNTANVRRLHTDQFAAFDEIQ